MYYGHDMSRDETLLFLSKVRGVASKILYYNIPLPGNTELASLDAGLAAVKLDDGLSIADSALGKSSVASVTTAGVTQFSEVSLITNSAYC